MKRHASLLLLVMLLSIAACSFQSKAAVPAQNGVYTDWRGQEPGKQHRITVADMPQPYASESVDNGPDAVPRPEGAWPKAPKGFKVELYASGFDNPRLIRTAPNGDIFLAESRTGAIKVLRGVDSSGKAQQT